MLVHSDYIESHRNDFLLGKVLWDIQIHFRKFIEVAEKAMTNDTWRQNLSHETRQWIREWYPLVKEWSQELRQIEDSMEETSYTDRQLGDMLLNQCSGDDFHHFLLSAALNSRSDDGTDDIGQNISRRLLQLRSLQRDIETQNFARLWLAEY